jgi:hypothetical protein
MRERPARLFWIWLVLLPACIAGKQYTIHIDPTDPEKNELCERSDSDSADKQPSCAALTGQTLDGSSTLAIEIENADPQKTYSAQIEQTTQSSAGQTPEAVVAEVLRRFQDIVDTAAPSKLKDAAALVPPEAKASLAAKLDAAGLEEVAAQLNDDEAEPEAPEEGFWDHGYLDTSDPAKLKFRKAADVKDPNSDLPLFGVPFSPTPPARDRPIDDELVALLVNEKVDTAAAHKEVANHVIDACTGFGVEPYDGEKTPWAEYLEKLDLDSLEGTDVLRDIGIDATTLFDFLRGDDTSVPALLRTARNNAKKAFEAGKEPTPAEKVLHLLYATSSLHDQASTCVENIDYIDGKLTDAGTKAKLATARASANRAAVASRVGRDLFRSFIDPMVTRAVIKVLTGGGSAHVSFGSVSLRTGRVAVTVSENGDDGKQLGAYEFPVASSGRVTISVGPMIGVCKDCFQTIGEEVKAGDGANVPESRILRREKEGFGVAVATLVHFPLIASGWFQFGPCIGYPVSDIGGATKAVLAGFSLAHRGGVSLSFGVHLFETRRLKDGYPDVIDTSQPGFAALTAEAVTRETYSASAFFSLDVSTDLLSRAGGWNND